MAIRSADRGAAGPLHQDTPLGRGWSTKKARIKASCLPASTQRWRVWVDFRPGLGTGTWGGASWVCLQSHSGLGPKTQNSFFPALQCAWTDIHRTCVRRRAGSWSHLRYQAPRAAVEPRMPCPRGLLRRARLPLRVPRRPLAYYLAEVLRLSRSQTRALVLADKPMEAAIDCGHALEDPRRPASHN